MLGYQGENGYTYIDRESSYDQEDSYDEDELMQKLDDLQDCVRGDEKLMDKYITEVRAMMYYGDKEEMDFWFKQKMEKCNPQADWSRGMSAADDALPAYRDTSASAWNNHYR